MANLLFGGFGVMPVARRKERRFRLTDNFSISDYTDDELRNRYRFGRESIAFLVDLHRDDLERSTSRNHALSPTVQVLVALRFFASGSFLQVIGDTLGLSILNPLICYEVSPSTLLQCSLRTFYYN